VLSELGLPPGQKLVAVLSFNAGVEIGQLAVLVLAWLLFRLPFRGRTDYRRLVVVPVSVAIAAVGLYWAVTRAACGV
jgi:ABC-type sugar transport system permease subunit